MPLTSSRRAPLSGRNRRLPSSPSVVDAAFDRAFARRAEQPTDGWLGDKMSSAWDATKDAASAAASTVKKGAEAAGEMASDAASATVEGAKAAAAKTKEMIADSDSEEEDEAVAA